MQNIRFYGFLQDLIKQITFTVCAFTPVPVMSQVRNKCDFQFHIHSKWECQILALYSLRALYWYLRNIKLWIYFPGLNGKCQSKHWITKKVRRYMIFDVSWRHHFIHQVGSWDIPICPERSNKRQQAEVKSLDHVFIPAEAYLNVKGHCN